MPPGTWMASFSYESVSVPGKFQVGHRGIKGHFAAASRSRSRRGWQQRAIVSHAVVAISWAVRRIAH